MKKFLPCLLLIVPGLRAAAQTAPENLVQYVKPIIGTQRMGHTYPGATVPFGMVQLSPDTDTLPYEMNGKYNKDVYKYCAGYQYDDKTIVGFSHTHFSGTGHSDLGDFLVMPTVGELKLNPGQAHQPRSGFRSSFSHSNELAEAGYYKVRLDDYNITAELTATNRVGFHQYSFPKSDQSHIILDLMYGIYNYDDKNTWTFVRIENDTLVTGYRQTNGWGRTRTVYFAMAFSKPFYQYGNKKFDKSQVYRGFWGKFDQTKNFPEFAGKQIRAYFDFKTEEGEKIMIKFALSSVSTDGALRNLRAEAPGWDFNQVKKQAQDQWNKELNRVVVQSGSRDEKENFYTSVYHSFLSPITYTDADGQYRGLDQNIHQADGFTNYTIFSLWDTYRALHPLFNVLQPKRNADMVQSMMAHYDQSVHHMLPVWSHYANENWCMIGYHSVSVIADAVIKGNAGFDASKALDACVTSARNGWFEGLNHYMKLGYVPEDKSGSSVSKTLEYAYDDWCIAQMAKKLGRNDVYEEFIHRSAYWKNVYDASIGYMRPKMSDGTFRKEFDVLSTHNQGFIEGNAWNYSLYVPHAPTEMIEMMGGKKPFTAHLDSLFTMHLPDKYFAETEDITRDGIIGNYVHGNEPSHHVPYLYNWTDQPWKTQERVRMILKKQFRPTPDGLGGNDDCGQMSAWYIFTALGFYPVAPGSDEYAIGSPSVDGASIQLENGKMFTIEVKNNSDKNVYVQHLTLNGKPLNRLFLKHEEILNGGTLGFVMGPKPAKK
ncbi:GH92 family glycosyl hydrolase [Pseudobacter ginsenosidimutans]|uniref:Putative alpha-1,2-mannosidase n=1 Tax=Pseudobacter ginsenosidimutans TaxID=661488 RepID=A0A4Q7MQU3_9BACT|nr:GH92 family glycosyl hydrolase [Pseudobacter ginsenosidimutans]QEC40211.1 glycoside hydrolase family 92 protein [Pseudobacter ginsenosidimutans]RZS69192.1 putative alpha-1,2-mannosidase [Pseudobacter ginsenosidimutans]